MTINEAISVIVQTCHDVPADTKEALNVAIDTMQKTRYFLDRPCDACRFHIDGHCTNWECKFDKWLEEGE